MDGDEWVTAFIRGIAVLPPSDAPRIHAHRPLKPPLTDAQRRLLGFLRHLVEKGKVKP